MNASNRIDENPAMSETGTSSQEHNQGTSVDEPALFSQTEEGTSSLNEDGIALEDKKDDGSGPSTSCSPPEAEVCPSSSSCCRICQIGVEEDEPLTTTRCTCRGHLAKVHRSCLAEWVRYRGSNRCEICNGTFLDIPAPRVQRMDLNSLQDRAGDVRLMPEHEEFLYYQALETLRTQLPQFQLSRRKRTAVVAAIVFLVLITGVAAMLTMEASQTFHKVNNNPWATIDEIRKNHVVFSICLSFSFFCVTLTLGLAIMWLGTECYFHYQRRRVLQRAANQLLLQRRRHRLMSRERIV